MKIKDLGLVALYIILHLASSGPMNYLLYLKNTRDFFDIPVILALGTTYKVSIAIFFLKLQKIEVFYIIAIIGLALITRILFHGPFPMGVLAGWYFLYTRNRELTS